MITYSTNGKRWYAESYLRSDHWKYTRSVCYDHLKGVCFRCKKYVPRNKAHIHHLTYANLGMETPGVDIVVVCRSCHARIHGQRLSKKRGKRKKERRLPSHLLSREIGYTLAHAINSHMAAIRDEL